MSEVGWSQLRHTVKRAIRGGAKRAAMTRWVWELAGDCEASKVVELWARKPPELVARDKFKAELARWSVQDMAQKFAFAEQDAAEWKERPRHPRLRRSYWQSGLASQLVQLEMHVRCRACSKCRKVRSRMWYARALVETEQAQRTWFGTITLNSQEHFLAQARARRQATRASLVWEELPPHEQFARLHKQNGLLLQLWLKRVRKQSKATLRFLLVCEAHKSGLPHYHCLVHEQVGSAPVSYRTLSDQWPHGFTNFKLVSDPKQAGYLCKYLSKDARARVRASKDYGQRSVAIGKAVNEVSPETPTHNDTGGLGRSPNLSVDTRALCSIMAIKET